MKVMEEEALGGKGERQVEPAGKGGGARMSGDLSDYVGPPRNNEPLRTEANDEHGTKDGNHGNINTRTTSPY